MPYTKQTLPDWVKDMPEHAQAIYLAAYNSAYEDTPEGRDKEEYAARVAISAVKKSGYEKNKEGEWVKMAEVADPNFDEVEIFEVGTYPQGNFTAQNLDEIVANFDPAYHEPPATLNHADDGPAYGWVEKLWRSGDKLMAKFRQISDELKQWVKEGKYKKRSVELWTDFEGTGKLVLKAVTWLGAHPPQVKGLQNQFASFTDKHGPGIYVSEDLKTFKAPKKMEVPMELKEFQEVMKKQTDAFEAKISELTKTFGDQVKVLTEENKQLKEKIDASQIRFSQQDIVAKEKRIDGEIFQLLKDEKITPAYVDAGLKQFLMAQPEGIKLTFGEGAEKKEIPVIDFAIDLFSNKIKGAPVYFGQVSGPVNAPGPSLNFKVINDGEVIDQDSIDLDGKAQALAVEKKIPYRDALIQVFRDQSVTV